MASKKSWYQHAYRRAVLDMHVPDWDKEFLTKFDAADFAAKLAQAKVQSVVAYAHSHAGLFLYPTKVGQQHKGLDGRNMLGQVIEQCHKRGIAVVVYTSLIFDRWAADQHDDWRMINAEGKFQGEGGRHGLVCPNSPYREYVRKFTEEICKTFDFEGLRFDMTFWPWLCFCKNCEARFEKEVGGKIPRTIDWLDERWVAFQRTRERWLSEFAGIATETVRKLKPEATVEHQSSTYPLNWMFGVADSLVTRNDFLQGDFYGDALQGSFVRKLLESLTPNRPFAYETSVKLELRNHTALKSEALLEAKASSAIADGAAFVVIDGIDPTGTIDPRPYERMGRVFGKLLPYYDHLGGDRVADIAIYYSLLSKYNPSTAARPVSAPDTTDSHTEAAMQAARRLIGAHRAFHVFTKDSLHRLEAVKTLVIPSATVMGDDVAEVIRRWVASGGTLYASGAASLVAPNGKVRNNFALADVLGVRAKAANWSPREHYLSPTEDGQAIFGEFTSTYPAFVSGYTLDVEAAPGTTILATRTLPWPAPDSSKFSSIHSNPPWVQTDRPELVYHVFGKGRAIYSATVIETVPELGPIFLGLLKRLFDGDRMTVEAPECVEATLFHQADKHRYILSLVNFQQTLPNLPVDGIVARLRLGARVRNVRQLPKMTEVPFRETDGVVAFQVPRLETLAIFAVEAG